MLNVFGVPLKHFVVPLKHFVMLSKLAHRPLSEGSVLEGGLGVACLLGLSD
jgi:hypothetical protein